MTQPVKYQGVDKESSGYKLLAAMGWQEGSGLGARQQGIKEHVKVKKKHDVTGVGALEAVAKARDWTAGMAAYDLVLAKMKPMTAASDDVETQSEPKVQSKKRKQPEATKEVVAVAVVAQPAKDKSSKKKRKKSKQQPSTAVTTEAPISLPSAETHKTAAAVTAAATVVVPKAIAAAQQAKGRHIGRYHRVTAAKKAKGYSSSDLAAILGVESMPAAVPAAVTASPSNAQESSEDTQYQPDEPAAISTDASSDQDMQQAESIQQQDTEQNQGPAGTEKQWWHGTFVKAGRMGNMAADVLQRGPDKEVKINGFSEQDQENLYMATQLGKTSGKKGLGKSTQPKDIGGVKWAGKKTLLDDVDTQNAEDTVDAAQTVEGIPTLPAQTADARQNTATEPLDTVEADLSGMKWKRKAKQLLAAVPAGKMKVKRLQKQLLQQTQCPKAAWDRLSMEMMAQLAASKQFELTKSSILLVQ